MAKSITEAELRNAAFDVEYEFARFRIGWRRLERSSSAPGQSNTAAVDFTGLQQPPCVSYSLGNNNATAVVAAGVVMSNRGALQAMPADPDPEHAIIEHVLLHFRVLIEFFFHSSSDKGYIHAGDFTEVRQSERRPNWVNEYEGRCNDLIAHLSFKRIGYRQSDKHHWNDILQKCRLMDAEIARFLAALPSERRAWFGSPSSAPRLSSGEAHLGR
jgi:hypothetical protein